MNRLFLSIVAAAVVLIGGNSAVTADIIIANSFDGSETGFTTGFTGGNFDSTSGLSFGDLTVSGGAIQRPSRSGNAATTATVNSTGLTADLSTLYFSVLLQGTGAPASDDNGTAGFATNSYGTVIFGDTGLTGGSGNSPAPIGTGGNAIGVGFRGGNGNNFADLQVQGVVYEGGAVTTTTDLLSPTVGGTSPVLLLGSIDFNPLGTNDVLTLYNLSTAEVGDTANGVTGSGVLPAAFSTLTGDFDQSTFNIVSIGDAQTSIYDEIRFSDSIEHVLPGTAFAATAVPEPTSLAMIGMFGMGLLARRRR